MYGRRVGVGGSEKKVLSSRFLTCLHLWMNVLIHYRDFHSILSLEAAHRLNQSIGVKWENWLRKCLKIKNHRSNLTLSLSSQLPASRLLSIKISWQIEKKVQSELLSAVATPSFAFNLKRHFYSEGKIQFASTRQKFFYFHVFLLFYWKSWMRRDVPPDNSTPDCKRWHDFLLTREWLNRNFLMM